MAERTFTVEEANELVPWLREVLPRIRVNRQVVLRGAQIIRRTAPTNGAGPVGEEYRIALGTLREDVRAITERGIILRDPESGLIDFPAYRDGGEVLLCWRFGEDRVEHWHGLQSGFSGRRPL